MAKVIEDTKGSKRSLPISEKLSALLVKAADAAGVDVVRVVSGAQCDKGTCSKRTGSTRHDLSTGAADLQLYIDGNRQRFSDASGSPVFEAFTKAAAAGGATGIGAGERYMGSDTIHVGFGKEAIWGAGGKVANAPAWLVKAVRGGWAGNRYFDQPLDLDFNIGLQPHLDSDDEETEEDQVE